jgi:hypothetical protein
VQIIVKNLQCLKYNNMLITNCYKIMVVTILLFTIIYRQLFPSTLVSICRGFSTLKIKRSPTGVWQSNFQCRNSLNTILYPEEPKQTGSFSRPKIIPALCIAGKNYVMFRRIFGLFGNIYLFIQRFLAKRLTMNRSVLGRH